MIGEKFQHPGFPATNGIPNPGNVQSKLNSLMERFEKLTKEIQKEKNKNKIKKLKKEKSDIGFKLFWMLKPV